VREGLGWGTCPAMARRTRPGDEDGVDLQKTERERVCMMGAVRDARILWGRVYVCVRESVCVCVCVCVCVSESVCVCVCVCV